MAFDILLPKIGFSMSEAAFVEWLVPAGRMVQEGEPLYTIESEKSTHEVESPASGVLRTLAEPGTIYPVGERLGTLE